MKRPIIFLVDDDPQVLRAIQRDVKNQYRDEYRVLASDMPREALSIVKDLKAKDEVVALFVSDQRMPEIEGVELLETAREIYPDAKRVLLTAYSDTKAAIKAINEVKLDYYLLKPWDPPEERLFPVMDELLDDWQAIYKPKFVGIKVIGYQWSPKSHKIKDFLMGNLIPYLWIDAEINAEAKQYMASLSITRTDLPAIIFEDGSYLTDPTISRIAEKIGLQSKAALEMYDVIIIGAGPAGLASSVYGASEGLKTLLIEKRAPGGQAGASSRIENYLGFPGGLSGSELARRAMAQAMKFGTEILTPQEVGKIHLKSGIKSVVLSDGTQLHSKAIILTAGVSYRTLDIPGVESLMGAGIYYGSVSAEAHSLNGVPVYIVGGGNSAGQAAMYLSNFASQVYIVIRGNGLSVSMSNYLCEQIRLTPNITVLPETLIAGVSGQNKLETIVLHNVMTDALETVQAGALFVFIGAKPNTDWLPAEIMRDTKGYVITGRDLIFEMDFHKYWKLEREPYLLETSIPGVFAAGDIRRGSIARVASAVGEGAMAIKLVHEYLAEI
jgi:thioredoxin reductase (NADPH)